MVIYIVRHPDTEWNKIIQTQGQMDSPLTNKGIETAENFGTLLRKKKISKICSSDLGRCIQTSEIINKYLCVKIIADSKLREQDKGIYNGRDEIFVKKIIDPDFVLPHGESFNQMKNRVLNFINKLEKSGSFLVVTHEGCLRAVISEYLDKDFYSKQCNSKPDEIRIIQDENLREMK